MSDQGFTLFETAIGACAIAWGEAGVIGVSLPEGSAARTRSRMNKRYPGAVETAPPPPIAAAIEAIQALMAGDRVDLTDIALDFTGLEAFERRVLEAARAIPAGETATYGELAAKVGDPQAARAVGAAMGRNPFPIIVPCHRVLAAGGKFGGFSASGGVASKARLLAIEKARTSSAPMLFDDLPIAAKPR